MRALASIVLAASASLASSSAGLGQSAEDLKEPVDLKRAQAYALAHHPEIKAADLRASAVAQGVREARAAFFPQLTANAIVATAGDGTSVAATGGLNNSSISQRESNGLVLTQLVTDFGRTSNLTSSVRYQAESAAQTAQAVRASVLLEVNRAFFAVLKSKALLDVADQTVRARELLFEKIQALAEAKLKSELDQSFAEVSLNEAKLLKLRAEDGLDAGQAALAAAMGIRERRTFVLAAEPVTPVPDEGLDELIRRALTARPELLAARAQRGAAEKLAAAEKAASYPAINVLGVIGFSPYHDSRLQDSYSAAGVSLAFPVFTGGRISARTAGARLQATAVDRLVEDGENRVARDVQIAWLDARTAYKAIEVTQSLLDSATHALELAQSRYSLGVSSIVELSQAELQKTEAEIANTSARYDYQIKRETLEFEIGGLT